MRIITGAFGLILLLVGLIGIPIALLAIFDPIGTQMADDNNPFGTPPSLFGSVLVLFFCLSIGVVGGFLIWKSVRKRARPPNQSMNQLRKRSRAGWPISK